MKKLITLCLLISACATAPHTHTYTIHLQEKATSHQGKFEIYQTKAKAYAVQAAAQNIRPKLLDFWVEISNKSKKSISVDASVVSLKDLESSAVISAVDPEHGLKYLEEAIRINRDAKAVSEKENIVKNFLRQTSIKPGKSAAGIVQFLVGDSEGKWQLLYKIDGLAVKGPTFISKSTTEK